MGCIGIPLQLINYTLLMVLPVNRRKACEMFWSWTFENVFLLRGHYTRRLPLFSIFFEINCHGRSKSPWVMSCLWSQLMFNIIGYVWVTKRVTCLINTKSTITNILDEGENWFEYDNIMLYNKESTRTKQCGKVP